MKRLYNMLLQKYFFVKKWVKKINYEWRNSFGCVENKGPCFAEQNDIENDDQSDPADSNHKENKQPNVVTNCCQNDL